MIEPINVFDCAEYLTKALPRGLFLNTHAEKFNSMVIGWGHLGVIWNVPSFTVYVRQSRFTKQQLDQTDEFSISAPGFGEQLSPDSFQAGMARLFYCPTGTGV